MIPHYCENCHVTLTDSYLMSIYKGLAKLFCSDICLKEFCLKEPDQPVSPTEGEMLFGFGSCSCCGKENVDVNGKDRITFSEPSSSSTDEIPTFHLHYFCNRDHFEKWYNKSGKPAIGKLSAPCNLCGAILVKAECMRVHVSNIETAYFCNQEHYEKWHLTYYGYPIG